MFFCFLGRTKTSGVARDLKDLQKLATANFQDRLVMTASICLRVKILNCVWQKNLLARHFGIIAHKNAIVK